MPADVTTLEFQPSELDELDWELLTLLNDTPLWKTAAHDRLAKRSVQTIGRRISQLQDRGLLQSCLVSPDNINRDLIVAYTTTEHASHLLATTGMCTVCHQHKSTIDHVHDFAPVKDCFRTAGSTTPPDA